MYHVSYSSPACPRRRQHVSLCAFTFTAFKLRWHKNLAKDDEDTEQADPRGRL